MWFCSYFCNYKIVDSSRRAQKHKFRVVSKICNLQQNALIGYLIPHKSHTFQQKSHLVVQILSFLLVAMVLAQSRGTKFCIG